MAKWPMRDDAAVMYDEIEGLKKISTLFCRMVLGILHYLSGVPDENKTNSYSYLAIGTGYLPNWESVK
jgi:hypothetical protein